MKHSLILPPVGFGPGTSCFEVGHANHSSTWNFTNDKNIYPLLSELCYWMTGDLCPFQNYSLKQWKSDNEALCNEAMQLLAESSLH